MPPRLYLLQQGVGPGMGFCEVERLGRDATAHSSVSRQMVRSDRTIATDAVRLSKAEKTPPRLKSRVHYSRSRACPGRIAPLKS